LQISSHSQKYSSLRKLGQVLVGNLIWAKMAQGSLEALQHLSSFLWLLSTNRGSLHQRKGKPWHSEQMIDVVNLSVVQRRFVMERLNCVWFV
jgi:hypothetical protein